MRHVYYVPGFFTGGPRFYRTTLAREAGRFARTHGVKVRLSDDTELSTDGLVPRFTLRARFPDRDVETRYALLRWEELVLDYLAKPWSWRIREGAAMALDTVRTGMFGRMYRLMRRFGILWLWHVLFYPVMVIASVVAGLAVHGLVGLSGWSGAAFLAGLAAATAVLAWGAALGRTGFSFLMINDLICNRDIALNRAPELWAKLDAFADHAADSLRRQDVDEVVVVGHSFGASLAPLVVARLAERHGEALRASGVTLLTLGGSLPLIGFHPKAYRFRAALQAAAAAPNVAWIDVSSSYDAMNFKRFDPIRGFGLESAAPATRPPRLIDTRFGKHQGGGFRRKWNFMDLHMQFIKSTDRREGYDYVRLMTSPVPIPETFGDEGR